MKNLLKVLLTLPFLLVGCGNNSNPASFEAPNTIPFASEISSTTSNNQTVQITLPTLDSDGDELTYIIVDLPENGEASFEGNILQYTPNMNYSGLETFTYKVYDGIAYSETETILIIVNINFNNTQPIIENITENINKNTSFISALSGTDSDGDRLTYSIVTPPVNGIVLFEDSILTYTPNVDYSGNDTFTFKANDGLIDSEIVSADFTITSLNNAPIIFTSDIPEGVEGTSYTYKLLAEDPDGDSITYSLDMVDVLGNVLSPPSWLNIDSANATISSDLIDLNVDPTFNLRLTATDTLGVTSVATKVWNIVGYSPFETTWNTQNLGDSDDNTIAFYAELNPNNIIDWGDGTTETNLQNGEVTHTYSTPGIYTIKILGLKTLDINGLHGGPINKSKILTLENWGSSKWIDMASMFRGAINLVSNATDTPDVSNVTDMSYMFNGALSFNQPVADWKVGNVTNMQYMFASAVSFNQPVGNWKVGNVTNMRYMFYDTPFNQDIGSWDVSQVTDMNNMFNSTPFNQDISSWDVSKVTNMANLFSYTPFNQPIGGWDVSSLTNMYFMFNGSQFNQYIGGWDVSKVTNMYYALSNGSFNQDVSGWDVSRVVLFDSMFRNSPFNQDISGWDVSSGLDFDAMFYQASSFDQDISGWDVSNATRMYSFLTLANSFSTTNYDLLLNAWSLLPLQSGVGFGTSTPYTITTSDAARTNIITNFTWIITDGGGI